MKNKESGLFINKIKKCSLFEGMRDSEISEFLSNDGCQIIKPQKGEYLKNKFLYVVFEGEIVVEKQVSDGRIVIMNVIKPVDAFNVTSVLNNNETSISKLRAGLSSICLQVDAGAMKKAIIGRGLFAMNMTEFLVDRIRFLNNKVSNFAGYSADNRLLQFLNENSIDGVVSLQFSISELAEHLGVGRASLYRAFDNLENDGKITRNRRRIEIRA